MAADNKTLIATSELAQLFGMTDRRIQQLDADGVIQNELVTVNGHKVRRYDLIPTVHAYVAHLQGKLKNRAGHTDREVALKEQKLEAEIALKQSQGELHRLKTAIASGDYMSVEEVKLDYAKFFVVFKKFAMSLSSRIGGMISGALDPVEQRRVEKEISVEVAALLNSFVIAGEIQPKDVKVILDALEKDQAMEEEI